MQGPPTDVDHRTMGLEGPVKDSRGSWATARLLALVGRRQRVLFECTRRTVIRRSTLGHYGELADMGAAGDTNLNKPIALNQTWPATPMKQACELDRDTTDECGKLLGVVPGSAPSDATLQAQFARRSSRASTASRRSTASLPTRRSTSTPWPRSSERRRRVGWLRRGRGLLEEHVGDGQRDLPDWPTPNARSRRRARRL